MFSDNIKDYILNNINERDFFDNKFLNLLRLELYKDEPDIKYSLGSIYSGDKYTYSWYDDKQIYISSKTINKYIKDYKTKYPKGIIDSYFFRNMCLLECLIHEVIHAYQFMWCFTSEGLICDVLKDGDKVFEEIVKLPLINNLLTKLFYETYHDIFPFEIHADNYASLFLFDVYDSAQNKSEFPFFKLSKAENILGQYTYKNGVLVSPLYKFYKKAHITSKFKEYNFDTLPNIDRLMIGELSDISKINEEINKLMSTVNHDYSRLIKKGT